MTRLASQTGARVFFIEEPLPWGAETGTAPGWEVQLVAPGVLRCVPHFQAHWPCFLEAAGADTGTMQRLVQELMQTQAIRAPLLWVYTPLVLPVLTGLETRLLVYDCMDELSLFQGAPPELQQREDELLQRAALVFAGGRSMYNARVNRHRNVHYFPSSVDREHFARAADPTLVVPPDARPGTPTLGFYGVLDERLDRQLLATVAGNRPDWSFVLVGPVTKIDPAELPQLPNLHYPGQQDYLCLPAYLKGWDVCLMPFALNEATRYISPTKTLEYLAALKPVVATPIHDVVSEYDGLVRFGATPAAFLAACEAVLTETAEERVVRLRRSQQILEQTSWEATTTQMWALIQQALTQQHLIRSGSAR